MKITFDVKSFSRLIKTKRTIESNLRMKDVSKAIDVSVPTISRLERGKTPDVLTFYKVCKWLEVPMHKFIIKSK